MINLKLIILSSVYFVIYLLLLITKMSPVLAINDKSFRKQIINDLPSKTDLDFYIAKLEKATDFCLRHTVYVDAEVGFGLFLIEVNLKELVEEKRMNFPKNTLNHLEKLLRKSNALTNYFHKMVHQNEDKKELAQEIKMTTLFYNKTTWSRPPDKFNQDLLKQTKVYSPEMLENMYGKWKTYVVFALDVQKYVPTPEVSDKCMTELASNQVYNPKYQGICQIFPNCQEALESGSDYGYGLLHRTLIMVVARFSRNCVVFSRTKDKFKTDTYCMMSFNEAVYIASNNFGLADLMFEQITLCGFFGHAQFFRNYWLKSLLEYQTEEGCFTHKFATGDFDENLLREGNGETWKLSGSSIMNGQCNGHFTSVALGALSNAVRYIIETHY